MPRYIAEIGISCPEVAVETSATRVHAKVLCMRAGFNPFDPNYQEMGDIAEAYTSVFTADAAAVLIIAFKTLKYFKLQRDLSMMRDTLAQARCDRDATEMRARCIHLGHY